MTQNSNEPNPGTAPAAGSRVTDQGTRGKLFVKSYGCQMNVYDAQKMTDLLAESGYDETADLANADLVVLNTCHIRERATEKIFSELGKIREIKDERRKAGLGTKIVVAGCVAQAEGGEILRRESAVDVVVGPQSYHRLPNLIANSSPGARLVDTEFDLETKFAHLPASSRSQIASRGPSAFLTIQEGCDKFCTFCVVPYTRGAELSRPIEAILAEARTLAGAGVRELTLLGQNVNGYHGTDAAGRTVGLAALCRQVVEVSGIARLRYTTSHPNDMDDSLVAAHADLPELMPFLHLPVQSGSDRILKAMNRKHTVASYIDLVDRLRKRRPDLALSSDFIVGFPGETDRDFSATLDVIRSVGFASSFSFKYSARPGTPAGDMKRQVPETVAKQRLAEVQTLLEEQRQSFNRRTVERRVEVLLERRGRHPGQLTGKTPYLQQIQVDGPGSLIGSIVPVMVTAVAPNSLFGSVVDDALHGGLVA